MRATFLYGAGDVRVVDVPEPTLVAPTDAILSVVLACICGSDLWDYQAMPDNPGGRGKGHEVIGVVESIGAEVIDFAVGDLVLAPFVCSDNTCDFCQEGLHSSCRNVSFFGGDSTPGAQAEKVRIQQADGTLVKVPVSVDSPLLPSILTLTDVMCTGHHAAVCADVSPGDTVVVIGDGAVGLCAVIAAKRRGAERIILMGRHTARTDLGREFGATDVVAERDEEGVAKVRELTGGDGAAKVLECVGTSSTISMALGICRDGGVVSCVGAPQYSEAPLNFGTFLRNITVTGGVAPARAYIEELMPDILAGTINPGKVFDQEITLDDVAVGYKAMADRQALKTIVRP